MTTRVLAGDIGGTHLRLALAEQRAGRLQLVARGRYAVADSADLEGPLAAFLAAHPPAPRRGCLGVAGTIAPGGRSVAGINLPWTVEADAAERACGLERLELINDFFAAARGIGQLGPEDSFPLQEAPPEPTAPVAVLGAGTGLGQAFLLPTPGQPARVVPSEGGHRGFSPRDALQERLLAWLRPRHDHVSTERVLSGPGLAAIYSFLVEAEGLPAAGAVGGARDPGPAIWEAARAGEATCRRALRVFCAIYGDEAANAALTVLARGGVYLAGGIAPQVLADAELREVFRAAFLAKGRFRAWLEQVPVRVVTSGDLGLLGAAAEAAGA